jgi:hypothetical protein
MLRLPDLFPDTQLSAVARHKVGRMVSGSTVIAVGL